MHSQNYYFARMKMNFPDIDVPASWEQFRRSMPWDMELHLTISPEEIVVDQEQVHKFGRAMVTPWTLNGEEGYLFVSRESNWRSDGKAFSPDQLEHRLCGRLFATKDYSRCVYFSDGYHKDTIANLHTVVEAALPQIGGSIVHASCIKHQGKAILFCGPSGMGKSTQAFLWEKTYDCHMLSSDAPAVFPEEDGGAIAYGMPWDGSDQIMLQEEAPVAAVIELNQAKENRIRPMSGQEAFGRMMQQGHTPMWDKEAMFREMAVMKKIAGAVPFYHLDCLPNEEAARLVHRTVFGED